jgi:hypothetical protein
MLDKPVSQKLPVVNSLTAKSILAGEKLVLFGRYILNFNIGIVHYILCETKTWHAKIYLPTQHTNWQILTSAKRSTHVIDAASFIKLRATVGKLKSLCIQHFIKLCEQIKIWQETTVLQS